MAESRFSERLRRLRRRIHHYLGPPPYYLGPVFLNAAGFQPLRMIANHVIWLLRRARNHADLRAYERDLDRYGYVTIDDFLTSDEFAAAEKYFNAFEKMGNLKEKILGAPSVVVKQARLFARGGGLDHDSPLATAILLNPTIHKLVSHVLRRRVRGTASVKIANTVCSGADVDAGGWNQVLHADRHFRCAKAYFYINDHTEENGAYVYCPGSHRLTWSRLVHEYEYSVREAQRRADDKVPATLLKNGRNVVSPKSSTKMNIKETHCVGRRNTLVISDNMGFHRRGTMRAGTSRKHVVLTFYNLQNPWYGRIVFALEQALKSVVRQLSASASPATQRSVSPGR